MIVKSSDKIAPLYYLLFAPSKPFIEQVFVRVYQSRQDGLQPSLISSVAQQLPIIGRLSDEKEEEDIKTEKYTTSRGVADSIQVNIIHQEEVEKLLSSILYVCQQAVYYNVQSKEDVQQKIFSQIQSPTSDIVKWMIKKASSGSGSGNGPSPAAAAAAAAVGGSDKAFNLNENGGEVCAQELKGLITQILLKYNQPNVWQEHASQTQLSLPKLVEMKWRVDLKSGSDMIQHMQQPCVMVQLHAQKPIQQKGVLPPIETIHFEMNKETIQVMLKGLGKIRDQLSSISPK